ncbi:hypothetical protein K438DRAFT_1775158 [Mycena galopus ATCC 62051]|nr:hypothetical protein K438DRAFT_1775158 [Mycena galopus ATCC 62051]
MAIVIVLMNGSTDGRGARGWTEMQLQVVSMTMGILALCVALVWVTQEEQVAPHLGACGRTPQPAPSYWRAKIRWATGQTGGWLSHISKPCIEPCGECSGKCKAPVNMTERQRPFPGVQKGGSGLPSEEPEEGTRRPRGTRAPGGSRNTAPGTEDTPCCYPTQTPDPTRQLWGNQREQGPRTGSAFWPTKWGGTDTESPVFPTGWKNLNKFSKTPTTNQTDPGTPGAAPLYPNLFQEKGTMLGNTGTRARNLNPKGEGYPGTPGSIPVRPRNRNLTQERAEARSSVAPGTVGPEATGRGQPKSTHSKKRAHIPAVGASVDTESRLWGPPAKRRNPQDGIHQYPSHLSLSFFATPTRAGPRL